MPSVSFLAWNWRQYSIQLYIILYSVVVFCYVCCLQRDSGIVCYRRSRNPSYRNGNDSLHFDSSWDSCEGCFPFAGYRMVVVSWINVFDVIAILALPETSRKEGISKVLTNHAFWALCTLYLLEIVAMLLLMFWETALVWRLYSICQDMNCKKWTS